MEPDIQDKTKEGISEDQREKARKTFKAFASKNPRLIKKEGIFDGGDGVVFEALYHTKPFPRFRIKKVWTEESSEKEQGSDLSFDEEPRSPGEILDKVKEGSASTRDFKEKLKEKGILAWESPYLIHQGEKFRSYDALDRFLRGGVDESE
jgi:hypothetical protein